MNSKFPLNGQWQGVPPQYPPNGSSSAYGSSYYDPSLVNSSQPQHGSQVYEADPRSMPSTYMDASYYSSPQHYPAGSPPATQHMYSPVGQTPMNYAQAQTFRSGHHTPRPRSTAPQSTYTHVPSHSYSHSHAYPQTPSSPTHAHPQMTRPRSNSQAYDRMPSPPTGHGASTEPYYPNVPIHQTIGISSDYSTSSVRPFACDLGEKPFLCNGGCGKTFTRKDANRSN